MGNHLLSEYFGTTPQICRNSTPGPTDEHIIRANVDIIQPTDPKGDLMMIRMLVIHNIVDKGVCGRRMYSVPYSWKRENDAPSLR